MSYNTWWVSDDVATSTQPQHLYDVAQQFFVDFLEQLYWLPECCGIVKSILGSTHVFEVRFRNAQKYPTSTWCAWAVCGFTYIILVL